MKREGFWHLASQQMYLLNRLLIGHGDTYRFGWKTFLCLIMPTSLN